MNSANEKGEKKLKALLNHGVEHNRDHQEEVREWAKRAGELDEEEVQRLLLEAAETLNKANAHLTKALKKLEDRGD